MRTLAGICLLLLIGMALGASMLVYSAYVLAAVFWLSRRLSRKWTTSLSAVRTISADEVEVGQRVQVQLRLDNSDRWPILWVLIEDLLPRAALIGPPPALAVQGSRLRICGISGRASRVMAYELLTLRRGYFQIGPAIAETGDLFGLHRRFRRLGAPAFLLVLPKLIPLAGYDVASRRPMGQVNVTYRLLEDPTLVSGIRRYQHGDPLRSVHWRATARTGQLQSKQYQPTCVAGASVVVDLHTRSNPEHHEPLRSDLAVTAAASICHTLLLADQQFGLVTNGRDAADRGAINRGIADYASLADAEQNLAMQATSDRLRPVTYAAARGPVHFHHVHRALARLERSDGLSLPELLIESQSRLPRDASVLVIVQEVDDAAAVALGLLRKHGYAVSAIVNNYENEAYTSAVGRLINQHVPVYHLLDESSIPHICAAVVLKY